MVVQASDRCNNHSPVRQGQAVLACERRHVIILNVAQSTFSGSTTPIMGEGSQLPRPVALAISRAVLRWNEAPPLGAPRRCGENDWMLGKT